MAHIIYVVEDDPDVRASLSALLECGGYEVRVFATGVDLLDSTDADEADCIVMDVNLPGESGLRVVERLRQRDVATPVIVFTAGANDSVRREAARLDVAGFLEKPVRPGVLRDAIATICLA